MQFIHSNLVAGLLIFSCGILLAQETKSKPSPTPKEIGSQIVEAIKNRDTLVLSNAVSDAGITIGIDGPVISAKDFKSSLEQKRGIYCAIFDGLCASRPDKSGKDNSLRAIVLRGPIKIEVNRVGGLTKQFEVKVLNDTVFDGELCSLFFDEENGIWKLVSFDYTSAASLRPVP